MGHVTPVMPVRHVTTCAISSKGRVSLLTGWACGGAQGWGERLLDVFYMELRKGVIHDNADHVIYSHFMYVRQSLYFAILLPKIEQAYLFKEVILRAEIYNL